MSVEHQVQMGRLKTGTSDKHIPGHRDDHGGQHLVDGGFGLLLQVVTHDHTAGERGGERWERSIITQYP